MLSNERRRCYRSKTLIIPAGEEQEVPGVAEWCEVLTASFDTLEIEYLNGAGFVPLPKGILIPFDRIATLRIRNSGAVSTTVLFASGLRSEGGYMPQDNRVTIVDGTNIAVEGIAGGVPVEVAPGNGLAALPVANDPLPNEPFLSNTLDTAAVADYEILSAAANLNGAWIYNAWLGSTVNSWAAAGGCNLSIDATKVILKAYPNTSGLPQHLAGPLFVPAGMNLTWRVLSAFQASGVCSYKLVP